MLTLLIYCLVLFALAYLFINKFISIAPRLSLIDVPNERSSHKKITPRGAGLVFGFIYFMGILFYDISIFSDIKYTLLAILIIYICVELSFFISLYFTYSIILLYYNLYI